MSKSQPLSKKEPKKIHETPIILNLESFSFKKIQAINTANSTENSRKAETRLSGAIDIAHKAIPYEDVVKKAPNKKTSIDF